MGKKGGTTMSGLGSSFSLFTVFDSLQNIDPDLQVVLKKLQKKDSITKLRAIDELIELVDIKMPIGEGKEMDDSVAEIAKAFLPAWRFQFQALVMDDDRLVRKKVSELQGVIGVRVGKLLAPHLKTMLGPWLYAVCDQLDEPAHSNTALRAFEAVFNEKKRKDVIKFGFDEALDFVSENLGHSLQNLLDKKENTGVSPQLVQERYERLISNSLMEFEYLISNIQVEEIDTVTSEEGKMRIDAITMKKIPEFFSSKLVAIRRAAYRVLPGVMRIMPDKFASKEMVQKVLGIFAEKDPSPHVFMWDVLITFSKMNKDKPWPDAKKVVLPRFYAFLRAGCYGSHEVSYSSIVVFLSLLPDSVVNIEKGELVTMDFFTEFFDSFMQGLEEVSSAPVIGGRQQTQQPTFYFLQSYLECIVFSLKKWSKSKQLVDYLIDTLLYQLIDRYFKVENQVFNETSFLKLLCENLTRMMNNDSIQSSLSNLFNSLLLNEFKTIAVTSGSSLLFSRLDSFLSVCSKDLIRLQFTMFNQLFKYLNQQSLDHQSDRELQGRISNGISTILKYYSINDLNEKKEETGGDQNEYFDLNLLKSLKLSLEGDNEENIINNLKITRNFLKSSGSEFTSYYQRILNELFKEDSLARLSNLSLFVKTMSVEINRAQLINEFFDKLLLERLLHHNERLLQSHILMSILTGTNSQFDPIVSAQTVDAVIQHFTSVLDNQILLLSINSGLSVARDLQEISIILIKHTGGNKLIDQLILKWTEIFVLNQQNPEYQEIQNLIFSLHFEKETSNQILKRLYESLVSSPVSSSAYLLQMAGQLLSKNQESFFYLLESLFLEDQVIKSNMKNSNLRISWYKYSSILPIHLFNSKPTANNSKDLLRVLNFLFQLIEMFDKEFGFLNRLKDDVIQLILFGLVTLEEHSELESSNRVFDLIFNLPNVIESNWFNSVRANSNLLSYSYNLVIQIKFVKYLLDRENSDALIEQLIKQYQVDLTKIQNIEELNSVLILLPVIKSREAQKLKQVKDSIVDQFKSLSTTIPNQFQPIAINLILYQHLLAESDQEKLSPDETTILLQLLQTLQLWYGRIHNIIKDSEPEFIKYIEIPLVQFISTTLPLFSLKANNIYLSQNQSQIIQSILSSHLSPVTASDSLNSFVYYQSLKLFNGILSNDNLKYILQSQQNPVQFQSTNFTILMNYYMEHLDLNDHYIHQIVQTIVGKLVGQRSVLEDYTTQQTDRVVDLLTVQNLQVQRIAYQLLLQYFKLETLQFIKSYTVNDQERFIVLNERFEKLLLGFESFNIKDLVREKAIPSPVLHQLLGKLMAWDLLLKHYSVQEMDRGKTCINSYLNEGFKVSVLLNEIFQFISINEPSFRDIKGFPELPDTISSDSLQILSSFLLYSLVNYFPSMVRRWFDDCPRKLLQRVDQFITKHVSPYIIQSEIQNVNNHKEPPHSDFSVRGSTSTKEIVASYVKDEMTISLVLSIPDTYPLRSLSVDFNKRVGVSENQWRQWLLSMASLLLTQDGSILDVCLLWKNSLDKNFEGVELCPICYSLFHNGSTPNFQCKNCKNKFHSGCIFKWFSTSHKNTCPLCTHTLT